MRFHVVRDPQARPAAYRKLLRAAVRDHMVTSGVLAMVMCGLVITACGSQNAPGAASSAHTTRSPSSPSAVGACVTAQLRIGLTNTGGSATGMVAVSSLIARDCNNDSLPVEAAADRSVTIDLAPVTVTRRPLTGSPSHTRLSLTWVEPAPPVTVSPGAKPTSLPASAVPAARACSATAEATAGATSRLKTDGMM